MTAPAWMPLYIADYLADTGHLSTVEHGAYMLLIMHYWQHDGLPADEHKLARISRMSIAEWSASRDTLADLFDEGWKHGRIDREIAAARETMSKRSAAGKAGASARYGNRTAIAVANVDQSNAPAGVGVGTNLDATPADQEEASPRANELDRLESELRDAAGLQNSISTGLFDLSPIIGLLDKGYDLASDILPKLRAAAATGKTPSTWAYYVPAITEGKAKNGSVPTKPGGGQVADVVWLDEDDPRWGKVAGSYRQKTGKPLIPTTSKHNAGFGAFVPKADYPELSPPTGA